MIDETSTSRLDDLKQVIRAHVNDEWNKSKTAFLAARLGQALMKRGFNLKQELRGKTLSQFVASEMSEDLQIIRSPRSSLVYGILPKSVDVSGDQSAFFKAPAEKKAVQSHEKTSFDKYLWRAFSKNLAPGEFRKIFIGPEIFFEDVKEVGVEEGGFFFISQDDVAGASAVEGVERSRIIYENIRVWLEKKRIDIGLVKAGRASNSDSTGGVSLLDFMLASLGVGDLQRISIPLDVIERMKSIKIR